MTREEQLAELARQADKQAALAERERKFHELQDSYYINYDIGDTRLKIRFFTFNLMTIPYSQIVEIELGSVFGDRIRQINLSNGMRKGCRIRKSRGWYRNVIITPREPKILIKAFNAFRSLAAPADETNIDAPLPPFLRSHDDPQ